jgi:uncharacterized protein YecE (DUF72 family)
MSEFKIGAGGWAYFNIPGIDPLKAYSQTFDFVEVNSTFYQTPALEIVKSWSKRVPENFEFAIRCHRDLTHKYLLSPTEQSCHVLETGIRICKTLGSRLLVMETPRSFNPNSSVQAIKDLLSSVSSHDIRLVWEIRWGAPGNELIRLMQDLNMVHCADLSREAGPAFESDILYSRLFGKGQHNLYQFDDEELLEIDNRVHASRSGSMYISFHGGRMYKDAARLKVYKKEGTFPRVTKHTGLEALREVLEEDARFPSTRQELIKSQGWKVIDLPGEKRIHALEMLEKLGGRIYNSVDMIVEEIEELGTLIMK